MTESDSVSRWICDLKVGDQHAAHDIWSRYVERLVRFAHSLLAHSSTRMADEEDAVIRAFAAFLRGVESKRFPRLSDRNDLWQILVMLTERHAIDQMRAEGATKRGAGRVLVFSSLSNGEGGVEVLDHVADPSPTPEFSLQAGEELGRLLKSLNNEILQSIAISKMEGMTNREIANEIGKSECTVERKLKLIRKIWINDGERR